jgi:hypothetical protein
MRETDGDHVAGCLQSSNEAVDVGGRVWAGRAVVVYKEDMHCRGCWSCLDTRKGSVDETTMAKLVAGSTNWFDMLRSGRRDCSVPYLKRVSSVREPSRDDCCPHRSLPDDGNPTPITHGGAGGAATAELLVSRLPYT